MVYIKQSLKDFLESAENKMSKNPQPLNSTSIMLNIPSESSMLKVECKNAGGAISGVMEFGSDDFTNLAVVRMSDLSDMVSMSGKGIFVTEVSGMSRIRIDIEGKPEDYIYALIV